MKNFFLIIILCAESLCAFAGSIASPENEDGFTEAHFPGGFDGLNDWIVENMKYPDNAKRHNISTFVVFCFEISESGAVENVWLEVEGYKEIDREVYRLVSTLPQWFPALQNGKPTRDTKALGLMFNCFKSERGYDYEVQLCIPIHDKDMSLLEYLTKRLERNKSECIPYAGDNLVDISGIKYMYKGESFEGGISGMMEWLRNNIQYPEDAFKNGIEDTVIVNFKIDKDSSIEVLSTSPTHPCLREEAVRVVSKMPKWQPALLMGKPISSYYNLPINFVIPK